MKQSILLFRLLPVESGAQAWEPFREGIEIAWLYRNGDHGPAAAYLRYAPGARVPFHLHAGYEHVFILEGSQTDHNGRHRAGALAINPPGTAHEVISEDGCLVLIIWERPVVLDPPSSSRT